MVDVFGIYPKTNSRWTFLEGLSTEMVTLVEDKHAEVLPFVSIVICTLNRRVLLKDCLSSIFALDYPKTNFEVIIVDGGSTDSTRSLMMDFPEIRFLTETRFGLAHARNTGAKHAKGSIIVFTDDDCIVDKQWLRNLVSAFQISSSIIGVGGPVYPANPEIIPKKLLVEAALGLFYEGEKAKLVDNVITSNVAFKREAFIVARFDESLGITRRGNLLVSGEDIDFCRSLKRAGYNFLYNPKARVYHQISPSRVNASYILKRALHNAVSYQKRLLKWECADASIPRIKAIRYIVGQIVQNFSSFLRKRSFSTCYVLIVSMATLFVCVAFLDKFSFVNQ